VTAIRRAYEAGETDEFVKPRVIAERRASGGRRIFCFNYRADRMRQIVRALAVDGFDASTPALGPRRSRHHDPVRRDVSVPNGIRPDGALGDRGAGAVRHGKTMFRTAETEKYAHVTYFFNGGVETPTR